MFEPTSIINHSLMQDKIKYNGDLKIASNIEFIAKGMCSIGRSLYQAEQCIKMGVIDEYGIDYYEKYGDGIHTIIEEVYNDKVRSEQPLSVDYIDCGSSSTVMY